MTKIYNCRNCGKLVGVNDTKKVKEKEIKLFVSCCYDFDILKEKYNTYKELCEIKCFKCDQPVRYKRGDKYACQKHYGDLK